MNPTIFSESATPARPTRPHEFSTLLWNMRSANNQDRTSFLRNTIQSLHPDMIALVETKLVAQPSDPTLPTAAADPPAPAAAAAPTSARPNTTLCSAALLESRLPEIETWIHAFSPTGRHSGVTLALTNPDVELLAAASDPQGRWVRANLRRGDYSFSVAALYAPASNDNAKRAFIDSIPSIIDALPRLDDLVLLGDLNIALEPLDRRSAGRRRIHTALAARAKRTFADLGLSDAFRHLNPTLERYSFENHYGKSRIDHAFTSHTLLAKTVHCDYLNNAGLSDHQLLYLQWQNAPPPPNPVGDPRRRALPPWAFKLAEPRDRIGAALEPAVAQLLASNDPLSWNIAAGKLYDTAVPIIADIKHKQTEIINAARAEFARPRRSQQRNHLRPRKARPPQPRQNSTKRRAAGLL